MRVYSLEKAKELFKYWLYINGINEELVHININHIISKNKFSKND